MAGLDRGLLVVGEASLDEERDGTASLSFLSSLFFSATFIRAAKLMGAPCCFGLSGRVAELVLEAGFLAEEDAGLVTVESFFLLLLLVEACVEPFAALVLLASL